MGLAGLEPCEGVGADVTIVCGAIGAELVATASVHGLDEIARIYQLTVSARRYRLNFISLNGTR